MERGDGDELERALRDLREGLPGRNEAYRTGTGELDNGEVRHLLAAAAWTVVAGEPGKAFESLAGYLERDAMVGWFGEERAELVLQMLLFQTGWTEYSTWLFL